ncbi:unnamed protein product [Urochloa humidicola]
MAESNVMDNTFLEVLRNGDSKQFQSLLDSEPPVTVSVSSETESEGDDSPPGPHTGEAPPIPIPHQLLRRVTSAGDGVLHIAARHGHLNLVRAVFNNVGVKTDTEQGEAEQTKQGEAENAREGRWRSFKAILKRSWQWAKSYHLLEKAAGEAVTVVVEEGQVAVAEAAAARESSTVFNEAGTEANLEQDEAEEAGGSDSDTSSSTIFYDAGIEANLELGEEVEAGSSATGTVEAEAVAESVGSLTFFNEAGIEANLEQGEAEETGGGGGPVETTAAVESSTISWSPDHVEDATHGEGEVETQQEDESHQNYQDDAAQGTMKFVDLLRARNNRGETCLHEAIRWGHTDIVRELIAVDAKLEDETTPPLVQIKDNNGASPLYLATTLRMVDIVECLTHYKTYRVSYAGPAGKTALHAAVLLSTALCDLLLKWKKSLAKRRDESGMTPLHYLGTSDTAITEVILGHDVSSGYCKNSAGSLPVHVAASRGRLDIIKMLLEKCPNCLSSCNDDGQTFLHVAILHDHEKIVKYVCTEPRFTQLLNTRDKNGDTALHLAVQNGNENIFCCLFRNKEVRLSFINNEGRTPLDLAFLSIESHQQRNKLWIANDLLVAGADFCTCRWDHFSSSGIEGPMDEKESEKLSKSAGLVAAGAALILSMSFAVPLTVANKNIPTTMNGGDNCHGIDSAQSFKNLLESAAYSLVMSLLSIFFCIIAGYHTSRIRTRSLFLMVGGLCLYMAAQRILIVFAMGLLQARPCNKMFPHFLWYIKICLNFYCVTAAIKVLHLYRVLVHVNARSSRLGRQTSLCSLFRRLPGVRPSPLLHIAVLGTFFYVWIYTTFMDIATMIKY